MKVRMTVDAGTSNSRIRAWDLDNKLIIELKTSYGVKIGKERFKKELENSVLEILEKNNFECKKIIASGMITSPLGLLEIPHLNTPISIEDLRENLKEIDFLNMKMFLIPGIKTKKYFLKKYELNQSDIIRGEESELIGVLKLLPETKNSIVILPGSHNKFIEVDLKGNILDFSSTLSGEILDTLIKNTILNKSISDFSKTVDEKFLKIGFESCRDSGFTEATFITRTIDLFNELTDEEKFSYLLGCILCEDLISLNKNFLNRKNKVIIAGKGNIAEGLEILLKTYYENCKIIKLESTLLSPIGALEIGKDII